MNKTPPENQGAGAAGVEGAAVEIAALERLVETGAVAGAGALALQIAYQRSWEAKHAVLIGSALAAARMHEDAVQFFRKSIQTMPREPVLHHNLGASLHSLKRLREALGAFRRAIELQPGSAVSVLMAGTVLRELGRTEDALEYHGTAIRLDPQNPNAVYNLGNTLFAAGEFAAAEDAYRKSLELRARWIEALNNLATVLCVRGKYREAIDPLMQLGNLRPRDFRDLTRLATALREINEPRKALEFAEFLVAENPRLSSSRALKASCLVLLGRSQEAFAEYERAIELDPTNAELHSARCYTANYLSFRSPGELSAMHRQFGALVEGSLKTHLPEGGHPRRAGGGRRLRIGYVSGDFCDHPVATFFYPLLQNHDRSAFEIFCYYNHAREDEKTAELRSLSEHWRAVHALSDTDFCDRVRRDGIDILVDLSGHSGRNRLTAFAAKPAPVQVTMIGCMQTTGLKAVDYRITDALLDPAGLSEEIHTEALVRMKAGAVCFRVPPESPEVWMPCGPRERPFTFGSFNNLAKINPGVLDLWSETLRALPGSRMHLVANEAAFVLEKMRDRGVSPDRVVVLPRMNSREYLATHAGVDLILDTFPFNGLTVTLNALWMGVPTLTLKGNIPAARAGFAIMERAGLGQFAADSEADFVRIACHWASHPEKLAELRRGMRERVRSAWTDGAAYARELEGHFREMWRANLTESEGASFGAPVDSSGSGPHLQRDAESFSEAADVAEQVSVGGTQGGPSRAGDALSVTGIISAVERLGRLTDPAGELEEWIKTHSVQAGFVERLRGACGVLETLEVPWRRAAVVGEMCCLAGESVRAEYWIQRSLVGPRGSGEWFELACSLKRRGAMEASAKALEEACRFEEPSVDALVMLGDLRIEQGRGSEAEDSFRKAIGLRPSFWQAYLKLSSVLNDQGLFTAALGVAAPAARLNDEPLLLFNLAAYQQLCGLNVEALKTLEKYIRTNPESDEAFINLGKSFWALGMPAETYAACEKAIRLNPSRVSNHHNLLHALNYLPEVDPVVYAQKHRDFARAFEAPILRNPVFNHTRDPRRRIRIGYISPDFREHSVRHFIEPILRGHTRAEFELCGIFTTRFRDEVTNRLEGMCDSWIDAGSASDEELADLIRGRGIDILVDLACHSSGNRLLVFPRRPAPVQITMIGMQQTTGLTSMDYRVTDADMDPPGLTEVLHSEKLMRLRRALLFQAPQSGVQVQSLPALKKGYVTFGSFNNYAKTHPAVLDAWAKILHRVPNSRLLAVVPDGASYEGFFVAAGIDPDRVIRMDRKRGDDYLRMHDQVDLALDCFPFAGLTVSLFAAWMGVPTVTVAGVIPSARGGVSILRGLGLDDWIAADSDSFVERAVEKATDLEGLSLVRRSMRERMAREITNVEGYMRDYESHLRAAWEAWCAS